MSLLIKNGLVWLHEQEDFIKADIFIENNKIKEIGQVIEGEKGVPFIDVQEGYILPGLIDCHTHLGIIEEATGKIGVDNNEISDPITPNLRAIDAVNPMDIAFKDAVRNGITTVMSGPGSDNPVGGLSMAFKTSGRIIDHMVIKNPVGLKVALGENPLTTYGQDKKSPVTRMGTASLIRELFMRTQDYMILKKANKVNQRDVKLEAVIPVLMGEIPLRAHAHRADDIITAVRIAEEFNIEKLVIEHGTEADLIADYLFEKKVAVAFGPMLTPRIKMELRNRNYASALKLVGSGLKVALITDHPYNSIDQLRTIAILAVTEGLSPKDALKCLTVSPAEILGCDDRIGRISKGYDADLVVYDQEPLNINAKVQQTIINGKIVYSKNK
ncbi:amidohydrolase, imidazolonepropionase [Desulfitobacterium dehalogenans ATCC 51507]|uniref:Amidohydrolase, imidazolonepropionase n=1 Tax=Desulfitobacterium dehalogenans (strain ATCC 51507 / DSM 9161 / JW/IU-DC1) TaxID=756499 RepID=I4AAY3_DESDJ|nr:amidohydrolase [Desulfitobacterium dehalogenans]AFM01118.1 amidohydrolase, imidazolonepropionase [Desulfitobacterium dehalogenans ATCC 51507]